MEHIINPCSQDHDEHVVIKYFEETSPTQLRSVEISTRIEQTYYPVVMSGEEFLAI